jgi:hypothetical protein
MKQSIAIFLAVCSLTACKSKPDASLAGSWVTPIIGQDAFKEGFSLNADGSASSINSATLKFTKWSSKGNSLILQGESVGNGQTSAFSDTLEIAKATDGKTSIKSKDGRVWESADAAAVTAITSEYNTVYCFKNSSSNDVAEMSYRQVGDKIYGSLSYQIAGKDKNFGSISGTIKGDTLFGDYTFSSEGTESSREVVMLKAGDSWKEGYGDVVVNGNKVAFKDKSKLGFNGMTLAKTDCPK